MFDPNTMAGSGMLQQAEQAVDAPPDEAEALRQAESVIDPDDEAMATKLKKLLQLRTVARESQANKVFEKNVNDNIMRNASQGMYGAKT